MRLFKFKDVVGNYEIKSIIQKSLMTNSFPHFTIFSGESGTGKSTCAEISALSLLCSNPNDFEPCGECDDCKAVMASILHKGTSHRFEKINLASISGKQDMKSLIEKIFRRDFGDKPVVFILEEAHILNIADQTALLEEIDKVPENVYVMVCTSRPKSLLKEFKNRAVTYNFQRLSPKDSRFLIDRECDRLNCPLANSTKNKILSYCHGVPRQIVINLENFIKIGGCSDSELDALFGIVDSSKIRSIFKSFYDTSELMKLSEELISSRGVAEVLEASKSYIMECCFLARDLSYRETYLSPEDKRFAKSLGFNTLLSIYNELKKLDNKSSIEDLEFSLILCGRLMKKVMKEKEEFSEEDLKESSPTERVRESNEVRQDRIHETSNFKKLNTSTIRSKLR